MARHYTLSTFLRQTPNHLLARYFHEKGLLSDFKFDELAKREFQPLIDEIETLDEAQRGEIDREFQDIFRLTDQDGSRIIAEELDIAGIDESDLLSRMESGFERAMWLFLEHHHDGLFEDCAMLAFIKDLSFTRSKRRSGLPKTTPAFDDAARDVIADGLKAHFRKEGRGKKCVVEHYKRINPERHCYFAFPDDYVTSDLRYEGNELKPEPRHPVFQVVFIYYPETGVLEMSAPGDNKSAEGLQRIFCEAALGLHSLPTAKSDTYAIDQLKYRGFAFPTNPEDGIESVCVVGLRLEPVNAGGRRVTVEHSRASALSFYDWMDRVLRSDGMPLSTFTVTRATLRVRWYGKPGAKVQPSLTVNIMPSSTNLKDEPRHVQINRYLKEWGIAP